MKIIPLSSVTRCLSITLFQLSDLTLKSVKRKRKKKTKTKTKNTLAKFRKIANMRHWSN